MPTFFDENISPSVTGEVDAALVSLGQRGFIASTGFLEGNFAAIQCLDAVLFDSITALNSDTTALGGYSIPAGTILYGPFTQMESTGGVYIAYKA